MRGQFKKFSATELYCPTCKQPVPVKEKLLLILPDCELYDYLCVYCGESIGTRKVFGGSIENIYLGDENARLDTY